MFHLALPTSWWSTRRRRRWPAKTSSSKIHSTPSKVNAQQCLDLDRKFFQHPIHGTGGRTEEVGGGFTALGHRDAEAALPAEVGHRKGQPRRWHEGVMAAFAVDGAVEQGQQCSVGCAGAQGRSQGKTAGLIQAAPHPSVS